MLTITYVVPAAGGRLIIDDYIPFRFRQSEKVTANPYLWRTGNFETSLLEITIDRDSHVIFGVTLTCFSGGLRAVIPEGYDTTTFIDGIPVADVSLFARRENEGLFDFRLERHDETAEIKAFQMNNSFILVFGENIRPDRCIRTNRIGFFERATRLCGAGFFDLSPSETNTVVSQLER